MCETELKPKFESNSKGLEYCATSLIECLDSDYLSQVEIQYIPIHANNARLSFIDLPLCCIRSEMKRTLFFSLICLCIYVDSWPTSYHGNDDIITHMAALNQVFQGDNNLAYIHLGIFHCPVLCCPFIKIFNTKVIPRYILFRYILSVPTKPSTTVCCS